MLITDNFKNTKTGSSYSKDIGVGVLLQSFTNEVFGNPQNKGLEIRGHTYANI